MAREPYKTLDGSVVTELIRPESEGSENLSVARATVQPGESTLRHYHRNTEEVYYVLQGEGLLQVGLERVGLRRDDVRLIKPGQEHSITCIGEIPLEILCLCAPPYQHDDTVVTDQVVT